MIDDSFDYPDSNLNSLGAKFTGVLPGVLTSPPSTTWPNRGSATVPTHVRFNRIARVKTSTSMSAKRRLGQDLEGGRRFKWEEATMSVEGGLKGGL